MIYAILAAVVLMTAIHDYTIYRLWVQAGNERRELESRLMAMTDKDAVILHNAATRPEPGDVTYVDEAREWELSPSGGGHDN